MFKHIFEHLLNYFVNPRYIVLYKDSKHGFYKPLHLQYTYNVSDDIPNFNVI